MNACYNSSKGHIINEHGESIVQDSFNAGGLIGSIEPGDSYSEIKNCYNTMHGNIHSNIHEHFNISENIYKLIRFLYIIDVSSSYTTHHTSIFEDIVSNNIDLND